MTHEQKMTKLLHKCLKKDYLHKHSRDRVRELPSMRDAWHIIPKRNGDGWYELGIYECNPDDEFDLDGYTDEQINEYVRGMRRYIRNSAYDCTGDAFTQYITWHRNASGYISIVHSIGIDN